MVLCGRSARHLSMSPTALCAAARQVAGHRAGDGSASGACKTLQCANCAPQPGVQAEDLALGARPPALPGKPGRGEDSSSPMPAPGSTHPKNWCIERARTSTTPTSCSWLNASQTRPDLRVRHLADPRSEPAAQAAARHRQPARRAVAGISRCRLHVLGALQRRTRQRSGCTLHYINAGIDTGDLIAHICPPVTAQDDELTLFWRGVKASAEVYCELLDRLERGEKPGVKQAGKGRLYQVKQRQGRHEAELAQAMRAGLLDGIDLPLRVRWFFKDEQVPG
jgi:hypothetical protein